MKNIYNNPNRKYFRQYLRRTATESERKLWEELRGNKLGIKFRRQHGIWRHVLDFYAPSCRLAIEVDGEHHSRMLEKQYDLERDGYLHSNDIQVLRFRNEEIRDDLNNVLLKIRHKIETPS